MKNKQHELHILKTFLASKIPAAVYEHAPELVAVDSVIGCVRGFYGGIKRWNALRRA